MSEISNPFNVGTSEPFTSHFRRTDYVSLFFPVIPCVFEALVVLPQVEIHVLDRQIPMRIQDFEAPLLFFLVGLLVEIELLDDARAVEIVVGNRGVLENDGDAEIPSAIFGGVIAWAVDHSILSSSMIRRTRTGLSPCQLAGAKNTRGPLLSGFTFCLPAAAFGSKPPVLVVYYHIPGAYALG
jgi:hypothetical protein